MPLTTSWPGALGGRYDISAGAHAKRVYSAVVDARQHRVFGCWQVFTTALRRVVLQAVDEFLGVFEAHAYGDAFGLDVDALVAQEVVDVACRVPCGEEYRPVPLAPVAVGDAGHGGLVVVENQAGDTCAEMYLAARGKDGFAHGLDDGRQTVGADVRMRVDQDVVLRPVLIEDAQYFVDRSAFLAAGIQLAVGVSPGSALAEAVVRVGGDDAFSVDCRHVAATAVNILATLENYRFEAQLY